MLIPHCGGFYIWREEESRGGDRLDLRGDSIINFEGVIKTYHTPDGPFSPLRQVSGAVLRGRITVVMGPSGTGKSTLFRLLNRLEDPDEGHIYFEGKDVTALDPVQLRRRVHYVFQASVLFPWTVRDNLCYPIRLQGGQLSEKAMISLLERVGLPPSALSRNVEGLSGGEKQRLNLARSLALDPPVLLLDEPTSSLDDASVEQVEKEILSLRAQGTTILMISHQREQAERLADVMWQLKAGTLTVEGERE